jgi:hypothetical protein
LYYFTQGGGITNPSYFFGAFENTPHPFRLNPPPPVFPSIVVILPPGNTADTIPI